MLAEASCSPPILKEKGTFWGTIPGGRAHGAHPRMPRPQRLGHTGLTVHAAHGVYVLKELRTLSGTEGARYRYPYHLPLSLLGRFPSIIHPAPSVIPLSKVIWDIAMQRATSLLSLQGLLCIMLSPHPRRWLGILGMT